MFTKQGWPRRLPKREGKDREKVKGDLLVRKERLRRTETIFMTRMEVLDQMKRD